MFATVCLSLFAFSLLLPYNEACIKTHLLCSDIKTAGGYTYVTNATVEAQAIEVREVQNGTIIGQMENNKFQVLEGEVSKMDNVSVTTHKCRNLRIKRANKKGDRIYDTCEEFIVLDDSPDVLSIRDKTLIGLAVTLLFLITPVCGMYLLNYILWKKKRKSLDASFSVYLAQHCRCCQYRGRTNVAPEGEHTDQRIAEMENGINSQQEQLLNRKSDSRDSYDVITDQSINMDKMTGTNDDTDVPLVTHAFPHVGQNGNMRYDPEDGKTDTKLHGNKKCLNGGTLGDQSPDRDKDEEQHSPRSQGSGRPGYLARGEGGELVHSRGSGSDKSTSPVRTKLHKNNDEAVINNATSTYVPFIVAFLCFFGNRVKKKKQLWKIKYV